MPATRTACQRVIPAQLIWPNGDMCRGNVWLRYTATDAAAVLMTVSATPPGRRDPHSQDWYLARDLLTTVLSRDTSAGCGDVIVERVGNRAVRIALHSPDGNLDLIVPLLELGQFAWQTITVCRPGTTEDTRVGEQVDAALAQILAGAE